MTATLRLTLAAEEDIRRLARGHQTVLRKVSAKIELLLENPRAGEPLRGGLVGFRKIAVADRSYRIVWRVLESDGGETVVEVVEIWAVGARADSEVYEEMEQRVALLGNAPPVGPLTQVIELLKIELPPRPSEPVPDWLAERLTATAGLTSGAVARMSLQEAVDVWAAWVSQPRQ